MQVGLRLAINIDDVVHLSFDRTMPCLRRTSLVTPLRPGDGEADLVNVIFGLAITPGPTLLATTTMPSLLFSLG